MIQIFRSVLASVAVGLLLLFSATSLRAQNTVAGALTGTVTDTTGAAIPNAAVTVTSQSTGSTHTVTSNATGFYSVENLPDGDYTVSTSPAGFAPLTITSIHLDPGQRRAQNLKLAIGNVQSSVNVEADAVAVDTASSESGGTISAKEVANLMLNGRNFQQLATLVPGVSSVNGTNQQVNAGYLGQTDLIVGGTSSEETTYTIDGVYNMTPTSLININITPSIDAINEMRVLTNSYSAKYGFAGSGQVLIETKSGTQRYHGSAYEYNRSSDFGVARPYAVTGVPATLNSLHLNIFGFTLGGPITVPKLYNTSHTKTFFFVGAEFKTDHYASVLNSRSEFTPAIRAGDLSLSHDASTCDTSSAAALAAGCTPIAATMGIKYLTCDSYCQSLLAARNLSVAACFHKDSNGVTNQLDPACFDPAATYFINPSNQFLPLPNLPQNNNTNFANYINTNPELNSQNDTIYRIDQHITDKQLLTLRYMHEEVDDILPSRNFNDPSPTPGATAYTPALNMLVRYNYNLTPSIINSAGLAYTDQKVQLNPTGKYNVPAGLFNQAFNNGDTRLPAVLIGSFWSWLGVGAQPNFSHSGDGIFSDDVTYTIGNHILQFGGLYLWNIFRANANAFSQGEFNFTGIHTGDTAGDFLLGQLTSYSQSNVQRAGTYHEHEFDLYIQDDWKATPRLTLSFGTRYNYYSPATMDGNDFSNFNPAAYNPAVAPAVTTTGTFNLNASNQPLTVAGGVANILTNGLLNACTGGSTCGVTNPRKGLFGPRLGFAYRLNEAGTQSLHGGYGIGYTQVGLFEIENLLSNSPFVSTPSYTNTQFSNPAGGVAGPPGLQSLAAVNGSYRPAMLQNFSLVYENEIIRNGILSLAYAGDTTEHIFASGIDQNFPVNGTTPTTAACNASPNNLNPTPGTPFSFDPCINTSTVNENYYRPYAGYSSISTGTSIGAANYNGLQTGFIYRLPQLQLNAAYTYSKALSDLNQTAQGNLAYGFDSNVTFQNPRDPSADYGRPSYDRTNVFTSAYVYTPNVFAHSNHLLERVLLSGFSTSGLITAQSGFAVTVTLSSPYAGLATRPNQVGRLIRNPGSGKKAIGQKPLYSYSSFALPAFGSFGDSEPGVLRGPKEVSFAAAVNKNIPITERIGIVLRAEAFNAFNHVNINSINSTYYFSQATNAANFGYAATAGDPRQMELSARINF